MTTASISTQQETSMRADVIHDDEVAAYLRAGMVEVLGREAATIVLTYDDDAHGAVMCEGCAPAPFDGLITFARFNPEIPIRETGRAVGFSIRRLRETCDSLAAGMQAALDRTVRRLALTCSGWTPTYHVENDEWDVVAVADLVVLDDALNEKPLRAIFGKDGFHDDLGTMRELRGQIRRRNALVSGITVDSVLAAAMGDDLMPLLEHLRSNPGDTDNPPWETPTWTRTRLLKQNVDVPPSVETVRIKDGHVFGRVRVAAATTWTGGMLVHRGSAIPQTTVDTLVGRSLGDLVSAPMLPADARIEKASLSRGGLRISATARTLPAPLAA